MPEKYRHRREKLVHTSPGCLKLCSIASPGELESECPLYLGTTDMSSGISARLVPQMDVGRDRKDLEFFFRLAAHLAKGCFIVGLDSFRSHGVSMLNALGIDFRGCEE